MKTKLAPDDTANRPSGALASLALTMLLAALGTSIANVGLPSLAKAFNASFPAVQWVVLAYLLSITSLIISAGRLGDLIGRRRLLLLGLALYALASALCGLATSLIALAGARALQGLGAAIMMALSMALVADAVPAAKTGRAMGLLGSMSALGTALGPALGGMLIAALGWPSIFFIKLPLALLTWLLAWRYLPADPPASDRSVLRFDYVGSLLLALALTAFALALTLGRGHFGGLNLSLLAAAGITLALFVWVQGRAAAPLLRLALLREPALSAGLAMSLLVSSVVMASLVVGPFYLAGALQLNAAATGLVMSAGPIVAALTGVPAGRFVDRHGSARASIVGLIAMSGASALLALLPPRYGVAGYLAPLLLLTAGYALFQAANNTAVMRHVASAQRGLIAAMLNLSRNLGLIVGASLMGAVFAYAAASSDILQASATAVATGLRGSFALATLLMLGALLIAINAKARSAPRQPLADAERV